MAQTTEPSIQQNDRALLIRVDERVKMILDDLKDLKTSKADKSDVEVLKRIVYGVITLVLSAVVTAILTQIM